MNNKLLDSFLNQLWLFLIAISSIVAIYELFGSTFVSYSTYFAFGTILCYVAIKRPKVNKLFICYSIALFVVWIFQFFFEMPEQVSINGVFIRIIPLFLLSLYTFEKKDCRLFSFFIISFFILECAMSISEKVNMIHYISYKNEDNTSATSSLMLEGGLFRSFALMFHPLYNANVVSIFLAFILCSTKIKLIVKIFFLIIGICALWGFNSRGVMIIWVIIFLYRFVFYKAKLIYILFSLLLLYLVLPIIVDWFLISGVLGRLEGLDFTDSSTLTRFEAFSVFFNENWSFDNILFGGRIICYPGMGDLSLENGILLDLGYWGLFAGSIKIITELYITYKSLDFYNEKDKITIILATWGVAFMNNNSFFTFVVPFFLFAYVTFSISRKNN